jgi:hypothetical protein
MGAQGTQRKSLACRSSTTGSGAVGAPEPVALRGTEAIP